MARLTLTAKELERKMRLNRARTRCLFEWYRRHKGLPPEWDFASVSAATVEAAAAKVVGLSASSVRGFRTADRDMTLHHRTKLKLILPVAVQSGLSLDVLGIATDEMIAQWLPTTDEAVCAPS